MKTENLSFKDFFNYSMVKKIFISLIAIVILTMIWFFYIFFTRYNAYKPIVSKMNQNYSLNINFNNLNAFQENFFKIEDIPYKVNKKLLYKIYAWPIISNWYDRAKARILEWKTKITSSKTIIVKRTVKENNVNNILERIKKIRSQYHENK